MKPFVTGDRARCINELQSSLVAGRLYYVTHIDMSRFGVQKLLLLGEPTYWQACRFERVPDPAPRKWPTSP